MVTGYGRLDVVRCFKNVINGLLRANMFHRDLQIGKIGHQRFDHFFDEDKLALKNISMGYFGMDAEHHVEFGQLLESRVALLDVGDSKIGVCRGSSSWAA